jgi:hypothetical protein
VIGFAREFGEVAVALLGFVHVAKLLWKATGE